MTRVEPNPFSPYADARPTARHLIPSFFGALPEPGVLALAACERMTVVPADSLTDVTDLLRAGRIGELPPGLCADCVGVAAGDGDPLGPVPGTCRECGSGSSHGDLCALCRQDRHEEWWPKRRTKISAQTVSKALKDAGFARSAKVPGGRTGVLSPITTGFKVWDRGGYVLVAYLPQDASGRAAKFTAMSEALTATGFAVTAGRDGAGEHLEVRVP